MADNNAPYQEIVSLVTESIHALHLPMGFEAADLGAGTGNFSIPLAAAHPTAKVVHLDADAVMIQRAREKAAQRSVTNLNFRNECVAPSSFGTSSLDLCVTVHALYAMPDPAGLLRAVNDWLRPGGFLVAVNVGRHFDMADWARFMFRDARRKLGLFGAARLFLRGREVTRQNRIIVEKQARGDYWTHSHDEFVSTLRTAGFEIQSARQCYRGYSDFAVCRKPTTP